MKPIVKKLDVITAQLVKYRDNWICQRCGRGFPERYNMEGRRIAQGLDWAHIVGRKCHATRWILVNSVSLCYGCHSYFEQHPHKFKKWVTDRIGKKMYSRLEREQDRGEAPDKEMLYRDYKLLAQERNIGGV